jgi:hypothetical protein
VLDQIEAALSLKDRFIRWRNRRNEKAEETVATRFFRLFETHGVHRNQIPRFLGSNLCLADVQNEMTLLPKLTESLLHEACAKFGVRREWLECADSKVYESHDFYKHPEDFQSFIKQLRQDNLDNSLRGCLIVSEGWDKDSKNGLLLLEETIGFVGDKAICRFHLCSADAFSYWKSRAYTAACVALAWRQNVFVHGKYLPEAEIERLASGEVLLGWNGEGIFGLGPKTWDPEDMAHYPKIFLKGIDPEKNEFGLRAALGLWLELADTGYMDTGDGINAKQAFQAEMEKLMA